MNYRVDRGGRIAVARSDERVAEARRVCRALSGYAPPSDIAEMQTDIGFAALNLEAALLPRPQKAGQMDLSQSTRHTLRDADHLIVLCDAAAAENRFIDEEVRTFLAYRRGDAVEDRLHAVWCGDDAETPLPEAIRETGAEPIARLTGAKEGWAKELGAIRAAVLGVSPALLSKLEQERGRRRVMTALGVIGGLSAAAAVAAVCLPMMA